MNRERPILFTAAMIRAIRSGAKTMTRRVVKLPAFFADAPSDSIGISWTEGVGEAGAGWRVWSAEYADEGSAGLRAPCAVGDTLWVREAWRVDEGFDGLKPSEIEGLASSIHYEADGPAPEGFGRYRHARFMPRSFSRLTLSVKSIRVERVQAICDGDIMAEGITAESVRALWDAAPPARQIEARGEGRVIDHPHALELRPLHVLWRIAWTLINGCASWEANPWVWAISFERVRN